MLWLACLGGTFAQADDGELRAGERLFRSQCVGCHSVEPGVHLGGPSLHALLGRPAGSLDDFDYSPALAGAELTWDAPTLDAFLADPSGFLPGNRMVLWGLDERSRRAIVRYLESLDEPSD
ncbi:c-type cytochrome [Halomonas sp. MCCC 1A11036]|uniref:C-type cytochrome n=1 Tax=Billgrantia zhangzhouensis TaxID=2733481 RepID=A0ABS9AKX2_9GAMM|nr:c-type cytochrome [Halomonas zhangzhouensis]